MNQSPSTKVKAANRAPAGRPRKLRWLWISLAGILGLLLVGFGVMYFRMTGTPADIDTATSKMTEQKLFQTRYEPSLSPIPTNQIHTWTFHVETPDGQPVENARITVDGGMPQHGHGLPTRPEVTRYLGDGNYRVEGMKFQMTGWWVVNFYIDANGQQDKVTFNLMVE